MNMQVGIRRAWAALAVTGLALSAACGGGGSGGMSTQATSSQATPDATGCSGATCGTAMLTMTDANGDFKSYTLDVTSINLKRSDGTVVETLPAVQRVDFAQLVSLSELLSATAVPPGQYVSGSITVDYTNAQVAVELNGQSQAATVVDSTGANPSVVTLDLQLDPQKPLVITAGRISRLALDFNLSASNTVDLTQTPVKVTAKPLVVASLVPAETKDVRVRGTLASVSTSGSSYVVNVRPFHEESVSMGQATVNTNAQTAFEINGVSSMGSAGLSALAALPSGTVTAAFGTLHTSDQTFTATQVLAGSSLESASEDSLAGSVIARSGATFTVRGGTLEQRNHDHHFVMGDVTVTVGTGTAVTRAGDATTGLTAQAISVGQQITVLGTATTDSSGKTSFDATQGRVRLELTRIWGQAVATGAGVATIALQAIDGRAPSVFNFAGTGATTAQDASAANYQVNTRSLPVSTLTAGTPARFIGFVTPFGAAPPDFDARTLVDFSNTASDLLINWSNDGTNTPFASLTSTAIVVNLANTALGAVHAIRTGPQLTDLKSLAGNPSIVPDATVTGVYAIRSSDRNVKTFSSFADFVTELTARLAASAKLEGLWARGHFDASTNTFTAAELAVQLN